MIVVQVFRNDFDPKQKVAMALYKPLGLDAFVHGYDVSDKELSDQATQKLIEKLETFEVPCLNT